MTRTWRSANAATILKNVWFALQAARANSQSRSLEGTARPHSHIARTYASPAVRCRRHYRSDVDGPTPNRAAALRYVAADASHATTRFRTSCEYRHALTGGVPFRQKPEPHLIKEQIPESSDTVTLK